MNKILNMIHKGLGTCESHVVDSLRRVLLDCRVRQVLPAESQQLGVDRKKVVRVRRTGRPREADRLRVTRDSLDAIAAYHVAVLVVEHQFGARRGGRRRRQQSKLLAKCVCNLARARERYREERRALEMVTQLGLGGIVADDDDLQRRQRGGDRTDASIALVVVECRRVIGESLERMIGCEGRVLLIVLSLSLDALGVRTHKVHQLLRRGGSRRGTRCKVDANHLTGERLQADALAIRAHDLAAWYALGHVAQRRYARYGTGQQRRMQARLLGRTCRHEARTGGKVDLATGA